MQYLLSGFAHYTSLLGSIILFSLLHKPIHPKKDDFSSSSSSPPQPPGAFPTLPPSPPSPSPMPSSSTSLGSLPSPPVSPPTAPILTPTRAPDLDAKKDAEIASLQSQLRASLRNNADLKSRRYNINESRATARIVAAEKRADDLEKSLVSVQSQLADAKKQLLSDTERGVRLATGRLGAQLEGCQERLVESECRRRDELRDYRQSSARQAISHRQQMKACKTQSNKLDDSSEVAELRTKISNPEDEIKAQESTIDDLKARNEELVDRINEPHQVDNSTIAQKDAEIDELKKNVDNLQTFKNKLLANITDAKNKSAKVKKAQDEEISALKIVNAKLEQDLRAVKVSACKVNCERCAKKDTEVDELKAAQQQEIDNLEAAHQKKLNDLKKQFVKEVEEHKQKSIDDLRKSYMQEAKDFQQHKAQEIDNLQQNAAKAISDLKTSNATLNEQVIVQKRLTNEANSKVLQHEQTLQDVRKEAFALNNSYIKQSQDLKAAQQQISEARPIIKEQGDKLEEYRITGQTLTIKVEEHKSEFVKVDERNTALLEQNLALNWRLLEAGISPDIDDNMTLDINASTLR